MQAKDTGALVVPIMRGNADLQAAAVHLLHEYGTMFTGNVGE